MFGYVTANKAGLSEGQLMRYRGFYCGLCRALRSRWGGAGRLTLTYDMAFLVMLLSSLYEPDTTAGANRCPTHPLKPQQWLSNEITGYGASLNIALAYHNFLDDWQDDQSLPALSAAKLLQKRYERVCRALPRQCGAIEDGLAALRRAEAGSPIPPDEAANAFGSIMGELFVFREDMWAERLRRMGAALGRFIYMMDAYIDLPKDRKRGRPNPLIPLSGAVDYETRCRGMLTLHLGECALEFEKLPLVEDADILRNILYSGVWTRYEMLHRQGKEPQEA